MTIIIEHEGEPVSIGELSKMTGIAKSTLLHRYCRGLIGAELITPPTQVAKQVTAYVFKGKPVSVTELSRKHGISPRTIRRRYRLGLRDEALVKPARARRNGVSVRIDMEKLRTFAADGMRAVEMARRLGVGRGVLGRALHRSGVYRTWQRKRYSKCSTTGNTPSPKTGPSTATAS
jgi:predicted transcriptional regulator